MNEIQKPENNAFVGEYLNPKNTVLQEVMQTGVFVDKSKLLERTNKVIVSAEKHICVTRPRRFGKTLAASMIANYYSCSVDNSGLFQNLAIASSPDYKTHLNKYNVIYIDLLQASQDFDDALDELKHASKDHKKQMPNYASMSLLTYIKLMIKNELIEAFPECSDWIGSLGTVLQQIHRNSPEHPRFVFVIDEWDHLFRKNAPAEEQKDYINFLCSMFKGATRQAHLALVYMTGIYPIKKYGLESLANHFNEYNMVEPLSMGEFMGFTEAEVQKLCLEHDMPFEEMKRWYDGYWFTNVGSVYNPRSVVKAIQEREFTNYWTETESYESLSSYINQDEKGLKQTIALLIKGEAIEANTKFLSHNVGKPKTRDDVLTQLVHLGYLRCQTKPQKRSTLSIPNLEILDEFETTTQESDWSAVFESLMDSDQLLRETWKGNAAAVAQKVTEIHMDYTSTIDYNDENSLGNVLMLAYFTARNEYKIFKEENTGRGRADLFFQPKPESTAVPMIIELKWNKTAQSAIEQVKAKKYYRKLSDYPRVLLVGINYDPKDDKHECKIETHTN